MSLVIGDLDAAAGNALVAELGAERTRFITTTYPISDR